MTKPTNRLGKGLGALIGPRPAGAGLQAPPPKGISVDSASPVPTLKPEPKSPLRNIPVDQVRPNPRQPRTVFSESALSELAASIKISGVLQPVLVRQLGDGFELVAGERRFRAAKLAGLKEIPAVVRDLSDAESMEIALVENLQREDLGPLDRALAYQQYIETFSSSAERLAIRLGESRANVINYVRLLRLSIEIQDLIRAGELSMGQARAILTVADPQRQLQLAKLAARRRLSVRQIEELAKAPIGESSGDSTHPARDRHQSDVETALSKALGLHVGLKPGKSKNSGTILIKYNSLEEFDMVAERLSGQKTLD